MQNTKTPEIYALVRTKYFDRMPEIVKLPGLKGVTLYTSLEKLQPEEGKYEWEPLDRAITQAAEAGKTVHLAVLGGRWTPAWVFDKGARKVDWVHTTDLVDPGSSQVRAPLPWDPIYLGEMAKMAEELGRRYASNPAVTGVQITGPALANGLETNFGLSREESEAAGYTKDKYIGAWVTMGRAFHRAFPNQTICLALSNQLAGGRDESVPRAIRDALSDDLEDKLALMVFYLTHEPWFEAGNPAVEIWREKQGVTKGAQMIAIYEEKKWTPTDLHEAVERASRLDADFVEIWVEDLLSPKYLEAVHGSSLH